MSKVKARLKNYFNKWTVICLILVFQYAFINQLLYLFIGTDYVRIYPLPVDNLVLLLPGIFVSNLSLPIWLFFFVLGLLLFSLGLLLGSEAGYRQPGIYQGLRWVGLATIWYMLMFSVPIDVLKFLHSFNS